MVIDSYRCGDRVSSRGSLTPISGCSVAGLSPMSSLVLSRNVDGGPRIEDGLSMEGGEVENTPEMDAYTPSSSVPVRLMSKALLRLAGGTGKNEPKLL